jgi:hypothetical protein
MVLCQIGYRQWQAIHNALDWQRLHDHARRKRQHLIGLDMEKFCQGLANLVGMQQTGFTCSCVGNPSIYDQSPNALFGLEVTLTHLNWRSTKTVLRENRTHAGTSLKLKNGDIFAVGFAHACTGCAYFNARHGQ